MNGANTIPSLLEQLRMNKMQMMQKPVAPPIMRPMPSLVQKPNIPIMRPMPPMQPMQQQRAQPLTALGNQLSRNRLAQAY
jgi:hypothetical protein